MPGAALSPPLPQPDPREQGADRQRERSLGDRAVQAAVRERRYPRESSHMPPIV